MKTIGVPNTILDPNHAQKFIEFTKLVQKAAHAVATEKGWWDSKEADGLEALSRSTVAMVDDMEVGLSKEESALLDSVAKGLRERNDGEIISLMHSELSEVLEAQRHGNGPSEHIPEFSGVEEELADVIIRIFDYSEKRGFKTAEAVIAKMHFNYGRPKRHGGKRF